MTDKDYTVTIQMKLKVTANDPGLKRFKKEIVREPPFKDVVSCSTELGFYAAYSQAGEAYVKIIDVEEKPKKVKPKKEIKCQKKK